VWEGPNKDIFFIWLLWSDQPPGKRPWFSSWPMLNLLLMLKRYILKTYLNKLAHEYNFFPVLCAHVRWPKSITKFHIRSWTRSSKALIRASWDTWLNYHQLKAQEFPVSWKWHMRNLTIEKTLINFLGPRSADLGWTPGLQSFLPPHRFQNAAEWSFGTWRKIIQR